MIGDNDDRNSGWVDGAGPVERFPRRCVPAPYDGACLTPGNTPFPSCVVMPNSVALGQTEWASIGVPKILEALVLRPRDGVCVWPPRNTPLPHRCCHRKFDLSRSNGSCVITEILQKRLTLRVPPFKVIQGHWNRHGSIGELSLPISVL